MVEKLARLIAKLKRKLFNKKSLKGLIKIIIQYLLFPSLCCLTLKAISELLVIFTNKSINIIATFFLPSIELYFIYRLIGLLITLFLGREIYGLFINRFLFPLFVTYIFIGFLGLFTDITLLSRTQIFSFSGTDITVRSFFVVSLGLYIWFAGINGIAKFARQLMIERLIIDQGKLDAYLILIRYFLVALGLLIALQELNLDATMITAISGGLAVGLGFGLKDILTNFISGIILLFERSIRPGDVIEFEGSLGSVQEINLRSTTIKTEDEIEYVIPNQKFLTDTVKSYTRRSRRVKYSFPISVHCGYKSEEVIKIILKAVNQNPDILVNLTSNVEVESLGEKNVYNVKVWLDDHLDINNIRSNIYRQIMTVFTDYGIYFNPPIPHSIKMVKDSPSLGPISVYNLNSSSLPKDSLTQSQDKKISEYSQIELLKYSFEKIKIYGNDFVNTFYNTLFEKKPKLYVLFGNIEINTMGEKMLDSLEIVVNNLHDPMKLQGILKRLGARHKNYGVVAEYYPYVCETLMEIFAQYLSDDWTPELQQAWHNAFQAISQIMLDGYKNISTSN